MVKTRSMSSDNDIPTQQNVETVVASGKRKRNTTSPTENSKVVIKHKGAHDNDRPFSFPLPWSWSFNNPPPTYVSEKFVLHSLLEQKLRHRIEPLLKSGTLFGMGVISETTYYRTYSRVKEDGRRETWMDTVLRVTNGVISILKTHFTRQRLEWNEDHWQKVAYRLGKYIGLLRILPPGRGLWAMGSDLVKNRGASFLYNCGAATTKDLLVACDWIMDMLMSGVGVGADLEWDGVASVPNEGSEVFVVEDSREGWVASVRRLLNCWIIDTKRGQTTLADRPPLPVFDYSQIRAEGQPLKTFGGQASGYKPLADLHERIFRTMDAYIDGRLTRVRVIADVVNAIGACVVAGNIRRSAEILVGEPDNQEFLNLKNMEVSADRADIAWMSNNSVILSKTEQFTESISNISKLIQKNGEPGVINLINVQKFGRFGEHKEDDATLMNPCVTGDTLILTTEGRIPVTELVGKQFVAVCDGKEYLSTDKGFWITHESAQVFEVATSKHSVKMTANHQIQIVTQASLVQHRASSTGHLSDHCVWMELQNVRVGDLIRMNGNNDGEKFYEVIKSITPCGQETVYDCTIPECGYFDGNGFVLHNCSEIPLEPFEVCNLAEVFPMRCSPSQLMKALELATFYTTCVTLLPTHRPETNVVVARNRRIGVSLSGLAQWKDKVGSTLLTRYCRDGYHCVVSSNHKYAKLFGIPPSIRVSTVKPSGSISLLTGSTPGMHYPPFRYFIRRLRIRKGGRGSVFRALAKAGYPWEDMVVDPGDGTDAHPRRYDTNTAVFEFPGKYDCDRSAEEVSMWEQFSFLAQLQREWADNSVSVTVTFDPKTEGDQIEKALGMFLPQIKSVSMLPHTPAGAYLQMPYEGISEEEYNNRLRQVKLVNWDEVSEGETSEGEKFCTNDRCAL